MTLKLRPRNQPIDKNKVNVFYDQYAGFINGIIRQFEPDKNKSGLLLQKLFLKKIGDRLKLSGNTEDAKEQLRKDTIQFLMRHLVRVHIGDIRREIGKSYGSNTSSVNNLDEPQITKDQNYLLELLAHLPRGLRYVYGLKLSGYSSQDISTSLQIPPLMIEQSLQASRALIAQTIMQV